MHRVRQDDRPLSTAAMLARIELVRHGPSAHVHDGGAIDRAGLEAWRDAYDVAGIQASGQPPASLVRLAADATHVISSDLLRAVASAELLARGRSVRVSELLRETPLGIPRWPTRLPLGGWAVVIHLAWSFRILRGTGASREEAARALAAAEWLERIVADGSTALVVTHGAFRRTLARQLIVRGWRGAGRHGGYRHWSRWSFSRPAGELGP